jgi:hypothetical protein
LLGEWRRAISTWNRNCHREKHGDVAISWRTGFRSQRDCFGTLCLAMTALLFVERSLKHERRSHTARNYE